MAVALGAACTATAKQVVDSAAAGGPPTPAAVSPAAGHPRESAYASGEPAGDELPGAAPADPGDPTRVEPRPGPVAPDALRRAWSPEAARAGESRDEVGIPQPPEREYGATTAPAPPDAVEVLPGPSVPLRPVPLVSARRGGDPPADVATAILDAYKGFWDSYWAAATHPVNPGHPGIGLHSTEPLRSRTVGVLLGREAEGIALRLPADHGAGRLVYIEGWDAGSAEVLDCFVDTAILYEVSTGRVRNDEQATVVHLALLRRQGGNWRVAEIFEQATYTGRTDGCMLQANTHGHTEPSTTEPAPQAAPDGGGAADAPLSPSWPGPEPSRSPHPA